MKLSRLTLIPLLFMPLIAGAHETWVAVSDPYPAAGSRIKLTICEGHDFPLCEPFEFPDTFTGLQVTGPDGQPQRIEVRAGDDGTAVAEWTAAAAGRYVFTVQLVMTHARRGEIPMYTTRSEVRVGNSDAQPPPATLGKGFEVVVVDDLKAGEGADRITLRATHNGRPAQASLQIHPEQGRKFSVNADRNGEASLRRPAPGRYLVYAMHQGVNGAVSFTVPE
jgi:hypothetical protein